MQTLLNGNQTLFVLPQVTKIDLADQIWPVGRKFDTSFSTRSWFIVRGRHTL